jgi:hypothetical protein
MFYFGIPSYKRGHEQLTLKYLNKLGYHPRQIIISTQTEEDYAEYQRKYGKDCTVIYGQGNCVGDNRNNILQFLEKGVNIVMLDDDIKSLQKLTNGKLKDIDTKEELDNFIENAFDYCKVNRARIWGVYPVNNAYFMKASIDKKNILIGCVLGLKNEFLFDSKFRTKEDYELCCREITNGYNCIRFNNVTANAKHKTNAGGCKDDWKFEINKKCADMLIQKYPKLIKRNTKKPEEVRYVGQR